MAKCRYMPRKSNRYPCDRCENKDKSKCSEFGGQEPITCHHCRWYYGDRKELCRYRRGYNIRPCDKFEWS